MQFEKVSSTWGGDAVSNQVLRSSSQEDKLQENRPCSWKTLNHISYKSLTVWCLLAKTNVVSEVVTNEPGEGKKDEGRDNWQRGWPPCQSQMINCPSVCREVTCNKYKISLYKNFDSYSWRQSSVST